MTMGEVAVICDSTCDMPHEQMAASGVSVVPLKVIFGPEVYQDNLEMSPGAFWDKARASHHHPKTSQPAPGEFVAAYEAARAAGATGAVVVLLSGGVSGTYQAANIAREAMPDFPVELVDTRLASGGVGLIAREAARLAQTGASLAEVADLARRRAESAWLFVVVDTLEWLQKNGRIGRASAMLGSLLSLKPILTVDKTDGVVAPVEKIRGRGKALARLLELTGEKIRPGRRIHTAVMHGDCEQEARSVYDQLAQRYELVDSFFGPVGSVIGTNVGPGAVGLIFYPD